MSTHRERGLMGPEGITLFLRAYLWAPADSDVVVRECTADDAPGVELRAITLSHPDRGSITLALTKADTLRMADLCEDAMRNAPHGADPDMGLPNLILALRHGASA
jgi:hypothetical protein